MAFRDGGGAGRIRDRLHRVRAALRGIRHRRGESLAEMGRLRRQRRRKRDNRDLACHVAEHPDHLAKFQYSVLQTFAPGTDPNLVVAAERRFKLCLDSVNNGVNGNY